MLGHRVDVCLIIRKCEIVFQSDCNILYSYQQSTGVLVTSHTNKALLLSIYLILATLVGVQLYLPMVSIHISLMTSEIEHLFRCLIGLDSFCSGRLYISSATISLMYFWIENGRANGGYEMAQCPSVKQPLTMSTPSKGPATTAAAATAASETVKQWSFCLSNYFLKYQNYSSICFNQLINQAKRQCSSIQDLNS